MLFHGQSQRERRASARGSASSRQSGLLESCPDTRLKRKDHGRCSRNREMHEMLGAAILQRRRRGRGLDKQRKRSLPYCPAQRDQRAAPPLGGAPWKNAFCSGLDKCKSDSEGQLFPVATPCGCAPAFGREELNFSLFYPGT